VYSTKIKVEKLLRAIKMALKDLLSKTNNWLRSRKLRSLRDYQPELNDKGLISPEVKPAQAELQSEAENSQVLVKSVQVTDKQESLEKLQQGFNRLIEQLRGINEHLNRQVAQQEDLLARMEKLPTLLESFPATVENQKYLTEQVLEQIKTIAVGQQQFIETVEKIPTEAAKQTDALVDIDHQLAAAADADAQMAESFNRFNETLDKLNQSNTEQTDSILQMNRTFAASDRYLKYIISRQNKRFMWMFAASITVCVLVVLTLVGIIIYLRQ
jgi:methyl-accepting chemotaxis protein